MTRRRLVSWLVIGLLAGGLITAPVVASSPSGDGQEAEKEAVVQAPPESVTEGQGWEIMIWEEQGKLKINVKKLPKEELPKLEKEQTELQTTVEARLKEAQEELGKLQEEILESFKKAQQIIEDMVLESPVKGILEEPEESKID